MEALAVRRLKRENCNSTEHDSIFSDWKILIEPWNWEDCPKGKEGCERYRIHNLPQERGPGVYELGIPVSGSEIDKPAVYVGQGENVRERLQDYGRTGAHLDSNNHSSPQKGCPLFEQIFSRGLPIVYRWAPMQSKEDAVRKEAELLRTYDYAWNTINNGTRRPDDILRKLDKILSGTRTFSDVADNGSYNFQSRVFNFNRSRPRIIQEKTGIIQDSENAKICGVVLGDGSICTMPPAEKRERCPEHKGMRTNASTAKAIEAPKTQKTGIIQDLENAKICGVALGDGSICTRPPAEKRERCLEHKGMKTNATTAKAIEAPKTHKTGIIQDLENAKICGVALGDGSICVQGHQLKRERGVLNTKE